MATVFCPRVLFGSCKLVFIGKRLKDMASLYRKHEVNSGLASVVYYITC